MYFSLCVLYLFVDLVVGHVYSTFALAWPCVRLLVRLLVFVHTTVVYGQLYLCVSKYACKYACCINATYTLRDCIIRTKLCQFWMLANQRLSQRFSATLSGTRIKFASCCWVVPAVIRSLYNARRELRCLKLVDV